MNQGYLDHGIPDSMKYQIDALVDNEVKLVLDIGSGPGELLITAIAKGVDQGIGLDLSPEMVKTAEKRLKSTPYQNKIEFHCENFLEKELAIKPEAISLHRVICCHPNRQQMLQQSITYQPKIITLTIPRQWLLLRVLVGIYSVISRVTGSFRPYIHNQKQIDQQLQQAGYQIQSRQKGWVWVTTTYQKK